MPTPLRPPAGSWLRSFVFAGKGLVRAYRSERNFRVQCAAGWAALTLAWLAGLAPERVAMLAAVTGAVLAAETINTAVEVVVDMLAGGPDPMAAAAKDLAAGAVLAASLGALAAGVMLFWPKWLHPVATLATGWARHPGAAVVGMSGEGILIALASCRLQGRRRV